MQIEALRKQLAEMPGAFAKVMVRTVNRVASAMRMKIAPTLAGRLGISAARVKKRLWLKKATARDSWTRTRFGVVGFPVIWAGATQTPGTIRFPSMGVRITRGEMAGKMIRYAFIATMKSGHEGVFLRRGRTRLKIDEQRTKSSTEMMTSSDIDRYESEATDMFAERIGVEAELILSGVRK